MKKIEEHRQTLKKYPKLITHLVAALKIMDKQRQSEFFADSKEVDGQLYDGFFGDKDRTAMSVVRAAEEDEINTLTMEFDDPRLSSLLPLYKARNFPDLLSTEEREEWEKHRMHALMDGGESSRASKFFKRLSELAAEPRLSSEKQYLLQELQLYAESILPTPDY